MDKEFKLTTTEYAAYYATLPHIGGGRPKNKYGTPNIITDRIKWGHELPGVIKTERFSNRHVLHVSEDIYNKAKRLISKKIKESSK